MNKLKLDIQFFADCPVGISTDECPLKIDDNELKLLVKQLKREVEELSNTTEANFLLQDGKIAELCVYIQTNLSNSLRCLLDSMISSGELDSMIKDMLSMSKISTCNSVLEMKSMHNGAGTIVRTLGYYEVNDGGDATYYIRDMKSEDNFDDGSVIMLSNSLVAELIITKGIVNVKQFGAYGDNLHDDTLAFKNANKFVMTKAQSVDMGSQSTDMIRTILEIPYGQYKVKGSNIFGSILDKNTPDVKTIGYKVIGNNASIIWDVEEKDDNLFFFDNSITNPDVEDLEILTINTKSAAKTYYGNIFRITAPVIAGNNYGAASGGLYKGIRVVGIRNSKYVQNAPYTIFNTDGNVMCDQSHVVDSSFTEFQHVMKSTNSQAVNWVFDRVSLHTSQEKAVYFDIAKCNDNFVLENSAISLKATQTLLRAITNVNSAGKISERSDYHFIIKNNRIEIVAGVSGNTYYPCYVNYGNVIIENSNFMIGGASQSVNPTFYLESHGTLILRNCNLAKPTLVIPTIDDKISGVGNYTSNALVVEDCIHNGYTIKLNYNGVLYDYTRCITDKYKPLRTAIFRKFNKLASFRNENFEIAANNFGYTSEINHMSYSNTSGIAFGEVIKLPPHQTITKVVLHTRGTLSASTKKIRVYFGDVSANKYKDVDIDPAVVNSNKVIFEGMAAVINNDTSKQTLTAYPIKSNGDVDSYQIISTIDIEYTALSPYNHFYKTNETAQTIVL